MNQSLLNLPIYSYNHIQRYNLCQRNSPCYLLGPPPRPPTFPKLPPSTNFLFIIFGIFLVLIFVNLLLIIGIFLYKRGFYHRFRERFCQTKKIIITDEPSSYSNVKIVSFAYNSITPLTTTTNESHFHHSDYQSVSNIYSLNTYEEIPSCYQNEQSMPYYYACEYPPSKVVCQACLLKTLHKRKQQQQQQQQQCLCHNFFMPIK